MADRWFVREYSGTNVGYAGELVVYNPDGKSLLAVIPFQSKKGLIESEEIVRLVRRAFR